MLYNNILAAGIYPGKWKIATVTPIPNATHPTDLRPILLLPVPGKLLEKHITDKIVCLLEDNKLLSDKQSGFRKGKSTSSSFSKFLDDILNDLNNSHINVAAYLDVKKAFDSINHKILLKKLGDIGIGNRLCALLNNYLSCRFQRTRFYKSGEVFVQK